MQIQQVQDLVTALDFGIDKIRHRDRWKINDYLEIIQGKNLDKNIMQIAKVIHSGNSVYEPDIQKAIKLYEVVLQRGENEDALLAIRNIYRDGEDNVPRDTKKVFQICLRALEHFDGTWAMIDMAEILLDGYDGIEKNVKRAVELYNMAAEKDNDAWAIINLLFIFNEGKDDIKKDPIKAIHFCGLLLNQVGTARAYPSIKTMCEGTEPNTLEERLGAAVEVLEKTVYLRNEKWEMYHLAELLRYEEAGLTSYRKKAISMHKAVVEQYNYIGSMIALGEMLMIGYDDVEKDVKQALYLFERAIEEEDDEVHIFPDHMRAMHYACFILLEGAEGVKRDIERAISICGILFDTIGVDDAIGRCYSVFYRLFGENRAEETFMKMLDLLERTIYLRNNPVEMFKYVHALERGYPKNAKLKKTASKIGQVLIEHHNYQIVEATCLYEDVSDADAISMFLLVSIPKYDHKEEKSEKGSRQVDDKRFWDV